MRVSVWVSFHKEWWIFFLTYIVFFTKMKKVDINIQALLTITLRLYWGKTVITQFNPSDVAEKNSISFTLCVRALLHAPSAIRVNTFSYCGPKKLSNTTMWFWVTWQPINIRKYIGKVGWNTSITSLNWKMLEAINCECHFLNLV